MKYKLPPSAFYTEYTRKFDVFVDLRSQQTARLVEFFNRIGYRIQSMQPLATDLCACGLCVYVCASVGHNRESYKTAEPIEMPLVLWTWVCSWIYVLARWEHRPPRGMVSFGGHFPGRCKVKGISGIWLIFSTLFNRWQQWCRLLLSELLQQLLYYSNVAKVVINLAY